MGIKREACDKWFSDVVRLKANYVCESCGKVYGRKECAHIYGRAAKSVRWSLDNAICLCHYCHREYTANPLEFTAWLEKHMGEGHMEMLREKWQVKMPTNKLLRKEIAKHYREEHKKMVEDEHYSPVSYN